MTLTTPAGVRIIVPVCVYRFYDAQDRLLYVGVTEAPAVRFSAHAQRDWWADVHRNTIEWYDTRDEALRVEARAIQTEDPIHNVAGAPPPELPSAEAELKALPRWYPRKIKRTRKSGDGSLFYIPSKNLWAAQVDDGFWPDGRRRTKRVTSRSREVAEAKLADLLAERDRR